MAGRWWLLGAILLTPLAVWPTGDPMQFRNAVFIVLGLAGVLWLVPDLWLRLFLGWAVVSFAATGGTWWGMAGLLGLLAWTLFYGEAGRLTAGGWRSVRWAVLAACGLQVAWMGLQVLGLDPLFRAVTWRGEVSTAPVPITGWLLNPMDASLFLGLAAPMLVSLSPWLLLLVALPMLVWLKATIGVLALAVTAAWLVWTRWPGLMPVGLIAALGLVATLGYAWTVDPQGLGAKPTVWRSLLLVIGRSPVIGSGPNALTYTVRTFQPVPVRPGEDPTRHETLQWNFAFNEWLQGAMEFGLVGVGLAAGYLVSLARRLRGRWARTEDCLPGLVILLLASVVSIPFRVGPVALLTALYLGRLDALSREAP